MWLGVFLVDGVRRTYDCCYVRYHPVGRDFAVVFKEAAAYGIEVVYCGVVPGISS